jgi:hypothetical protein
VKSASTANSVECVVTRDPEEPGNRAVGNRELTVAADSVVEDILQEILRQRSIRDHLHEKFAESPLAAHEELLDIPHPDLVGRPATYRSVTCTSVHCDLAAAVHTHTLSIAVDL